MTSAARAIRPAAPTITIEQVTATMAATWLGTMDPKRHMRQSAVQRYAREMIAGKWLLNGEAIKFDRAGKLIDGQHRLAAVMMCGLTVTMLVVRGVEAGATITLDTGVSRTFYDAGVIAGTPYPTGSAAVARWWYRYESGSPTVKLTPTHQELAAMVVQHPSIADSCAFVHAHKVLHQRCTSSVQAFVHAWASEHYDRELSDSFMEDLNDGAGLAKDSPIYLLRRRLVDDDSKRRLESTHVLALTIKAWNAWFDGEKLTILVWRSGGETPEPFPRFGDRRPGVKHSRKRATLGRASGTVLKVNA